MELTALRIQMNRDSNSGYSELLTLTACSF